MKKKESRFRYNEHTFANKIRLIHNQGRHQKFTTFVLNEKIDADKYDYQTWLEILEENDADNETIKDFNAIWNAF